MIAECHITCGSWGAGLLAFQQIIDAMWMVGAFVLAFAAGYICGGIVQRS